MNKPNRKSLRQRKNSSRDSQYENLEPRRLLAITAIGGDLSGSIVEDSTEIILGIAEPIGIEPGTTVDVFSDGIVQGTYGELDLSSVGLWGYRLTDASNVLNEGEVATDFITISTLEGITATVEIEVTGVNDDASISGDITGETDEDATSPILGTLSANDADGQQNGFLTIDSAAGSYGAFSIDAAGDWTYVVDNAAVQFLGDNESVSESFTVESIDGTDTEVVTVTITGSDEVVEENDNILNDNGVLTITGGDGDDQVDVSIDDNGMISVTGSLGTEVFDPADVDSVFIDMGAGDDTVSLGNDVVINAIINGGDGNDCIHGGGGDDTIRGGDGNDWISGRDGNDILVGGEGKDKLRGNAGRDILLGGDQSDRLVGGQGDDIMVGGLTSFDNDDAILDLIRTEWTRTDIGAYHRAYNLYFGQGTLDGSGFRVRHGESIFSDGDRDRLNWFDPGLDWYL